jgi:hypothetical protein
MTACIADFKVNLNLLVQIVAALLVCWACSRPGGLGHHNVPNLEAFNCWPNRHLTILIVRLRFTLQDRAAQTDSSFSPHILALDMANACACGHVSNPANSEGSSSLPWQLRGAMQVSQWDAEIVFLPRF